jgi:hypothetical protein
MKKISVLILLFPALLFLCESDSSKTDDEKLSLTQKLGKKGSEIELPTYSGNHIEGKVVDSDSDGKGDGLDLNGDNTPEMNYDLSGTLSAKITKNIFASFTKSESGDTIAFWFTGLTDNIYYLIDDSGDILISNDTTLENAVITFVVDSGLIQGLNTGSEGGAVDIAIDSLTGIAPLFTDSSDGTLTVMVIYGEIGSKLYYSVFDEGVEFTETGETNMDPHAMGIVDIGSDGTGQFISVEATGNMNTGENVKVLEGNKRYVIASLFDLAPVEFDYMTMTGIGNEDGYGQAVIGLNGNTTVILNRNTDFCFPLEGSELCSFYR